MILGVGVDIVENKRVEKLLRKFGLSYLRKFLTEEEIKMVDIKSVEHICGLFAAKEAVVKALGNAGYDKVGYRDFALLRREVSIIVRGQLKGFRGKVHFSITHEKEYSVAVAIAETM